MTNYGHTAHRKFWRHNLSGMCTALVLTIMALCAAMSQCDAQAAPKVGPLTAEQEAFFPKDAQFDSDLWRQFSKPYRNLKDKKRVRLTFTDGWNGGACFAWHQNQTLWGGSLVNGCVKIKLHPKLPHPERYAFLPWNEVNPREHIGVIRASYLASQGAQGAEFQSASSKEFYWHKMAPIVRKLLEEGRVRMEETDADLSNRGMKEKVFAVTYLSLSACLEQDATESVDHTFLFIDSSSAFAKSFNQDQPEEQPFLYEGKVYFPRTDGLTETYGLVIPTCEFKPPSELYPQPRRQQ